MDNIAYDGTWDTRRHFVTKSDSEKLNDLFNLIKEKRNEVKSEVMNELFEQALRIMSS